MTQLLDLENKFQNYLLSSQQDIFQHIVSTHKVPADIRLNIYKNAYRARLHEALMTSYPALQSYLGYEQFEALCDGYIDAHPSHFRSIRWFGDQLPDFLKQHSDYKAFPYLAELAQFEWTLALVFDAADSRTIPLDEMANIPPDAWINMRLQTHPSIYRLTLFWNSVAIWQAMLDEKMPDDPQQNTSGTHWILWRKELTSHFTALSEEEAWAIDALINGATFGDICEGLCQWVNEEEAGMRAASLLKSWITAGLITKIDLIDL